LRIKYTKYFLVHYRCGTRLSRLPGCNRGAEDIFAAHNVKSLADVADERDEGLPVRGAVEAI